MDPFEVALARVSEVVALVYAISLVPVVASTIAMVGVAVLGLFFSRPRVQNSIITSHHHEEPPFVTVQIPVFDDVVAVRCIEACLAFDYPAHRFEIMVLDDSTTHATRSRLAELASQRSQRPALIYRHRAHRDGYKPGALVAAMPHVRGELIAVFDADFVPDPSILAKLVEPFRRDPRVGIVQGRQGFLNENRSLVARFAACLLSIQHQVVLPLASWFGVVFFCGTAGMLRRAAIEDAGGWNTNSITEDADLSVRMIAKGWDSIYLPIETPGEVPITLRAFLRQQMRWCFGGVRVFFDHASLILRSPTLRLSQRLLIAYLTLGNVVALPVAMMTAAGLASWFVVALAHLNGQGQRQPGVLQTGLDGRIGLACTAGFIAVAALALYRRAKLRELPWLIVGACTVALALAFANALAVVRAIVRSKEPLFGVQSSWICTPKLGNHDDLKTTTTTTTTIAAGGPTPSLRS